MKRKLNRYAWVLFLAPSMFGVSLFVLLPFLDVVKRSFTTAVTGEFSGLENYKRVMENAAFKLAAGNTVRFTLVCLPVLIVTGLIIAVKLSRLKQIQLLKSCFLFPMAMPAATVVLIWKMVFYKQGGLNLVLTDLCAVFYSILDKMEQSSVYLWISDLLTGFGKAGLPEIQSVLEEMAVTGVSIDYMNSGAAFWILVFSYVWKNLGYTVVLWLSGIMNISSDILEAAKMDGAGERQSFLYVTLPNLRGTMYTITVLSFLNSFKVFREAYLVAGSYPHESMYLLQQLFNNWFTYLELDKMAAAAVCIGIVLFFCILILQKLWDK